METVRNAAVMAACKARELRAWAARRNCGSSPPRAGRLRELSLERYLADVDDGWIMRRARTYRGALQVEDEEKSGRVITSARPTVKRACSPFAGRVSVRLAEFNARVRALAAALMRRGFAKEAIALCDAKPESLRQAGFLSRDAAVVYVFIKLALPLALGFVMIGLTSMTNLLNLPAPSAGTIFQTQTAAAVSHCIKINAAGTTYYIMVSNAL